MHRSTGAYWRGRRDHHVGDDNVILPAQHSKLRDVARRLLDIAEKRILLIVGHWDAAACGDVMDLVGVEHVQRLLQIGMELSAGGRVKAFSKQIDRVEPSW